MITPSLHVCTEFELYQKLMLKLIDSDAEIIITHAIDDKATLYTLVEPTTREILVSAWLSSKNGQFLRLVQPKLMLN